MGLKETKVYDHMLLDNSEIILRKKQRVRAAGAGLKRDESESNRRNERGIYRNGRIPVKPGCVEKTAG